MNTYQKQHNTPKDVIPAPRRMDFTFDATIPRYVFKNNTILTAWAAAMSTVFPDGERFFINSARHFEKDISDPELRKAIKAFIGQEAHHGREHDALNDWFASQGLDVATAQVQLKNALNFVSKTISPKMQLAVTAALEHFTAMLADIYLRDDEIRKSMDPRIETVFYWHAIEETEHKAVAYDVYEAIGGGYLMRSSIMLATSLGLLFGIVLIQSRYLYQWKALGDGRGWIDAFRFFWAKPGFLRKTLPSYLRYFKPGFHPWQEDNRDLLTNWQSQIEKFMPETHKNFQLKETINS